MVSVAEGNLVVEVGPTPVFPVLDVVDLAMVERNGAIGDGTGLVDCFECSSLMRGGQTSGPSDIDGHAPTVENNRDDLGLTGESPDGFDRDIGSE